MSYIGNDLGRIMPAGLRIVTDLAGTFQGEGLGKPGRRDHPATLASAASSRVASA
jgi:hypothetical protein